MNKITTTATGKNNTIKSNSKQTVTAQNIVSIELWPLGSRQSLWRTANGHDHA